MGTNGSKRGFGGRHKRLGGFSGHCGLSEFERFFEKVFDVHFFACFPLILYQNDYKSL